MIAELSYKELLKDPRWQKIRLQVLERDKWCCQSCFDDTSTLSVHHRYYEKDKEPWDYPLEAFITLCEQCHKDEKELTKESSGLLLKELKRHFLASDLHILACGLNRMKLLHIPEVVASMLEWLFSNPKIQQELLDRYFDYVHEKAKGIKENASNKIYKT